MPAKWFNVCAIAFSLMFVGTAMASKDLDGDIDVAIGGTEVDKAEVGDHSFHIKPITVVKRGSTVFANGRLSHRKRGPDDQVDYSIKIRAGQEPEVTYKIGHGGWQKVFGKAGKIVDGRVHGESWEETAKFIIDTIALKLTPEDPPKNPLKK